MLHDDEKAVLWDFFKKKKGQLFPYVFRHEGETVEINFGRIVCQVCHSPVQDILGDAQELQHGAKGISIDFSARALCMAYRSLSHIRMRYYPQQTRLVWFDGSSWHESEERKILGFSSTGSVTPFVCRLLLLIK